MSDFRARLDALRQRVSIEDVVRAAGVKLSKGRKPRGKCPFHGSKSDSFVVDTDKGTARCYGCGWPEQGAGDVIRFTMDHHGDSFREALDRLDGGNFEIPGTPALRTAKRQSRRPDVEHVDSATMGRWIWRGTTRQPDAVRRYFRGRGIPDSVLGDDRLGDIRFHALAPIISWPEDQDGPARDCPRAPAICALIRAPVLVGDQLRFVPIGLHVTFLAPSLDGKMVRPRRDGSMFEDRKMLGRAGGGCVLLGPTAPGEDPRAVTIDRTAPLFCGEGTETVLSGMALADAPAHAIGVAMLSLGTLGGKPARWKGGVLPLHDIRPDPASPALTFPHDGPVVGLIDADMKPLRGPVDRRSGERRGLPVVERRGGPIVTRAITTAERAAICAELFVKSWRAAGCRRVTAARPRMGQDFNDAIRGG